MRNLSTLEPLIKKFGPGRIGVCLGDVTKAETSQNAVKLAVSSFGQLDAVIANAGVLDPVGPISDAVVGNWKNLYDVNFFSVVDLVVAALPELRRAGSGRVIAVLSGASTKSYDGWAAYGSSKAALNHFIQSVAEEEAEHGVNAISVAPGVVNTSMQEDIREKFGSNMKPEALQRFLDFHKNGDLLEPEVPAKVYVELALNGWSSKINGGYWRYNDEVLN